MLLTCQHPNAALHHCNDQQPFQPGTCVAKLVEFFGHYLKAKQLPVKQKPKLISTMVGY